jgi:L-iditol 2-dehydrogenase
MRGRDVLDRRTLRGRSRSKARPSAFIADRKVDVARLFTHRRRLEQAEEAYRLFDTQTTGKAVILPS